MVPFVVAVGLVGVTAVLAVTGLLALYPLGGDTGAWNLLSRSLPPETFWSQYEWSPKPYHILHPMAGVTLWALIILFYAGIDHLRDRLLRRSHA